MKSKKVLDNLIKNWFKISLLALLTLSVYQIGAIKAEIQAGGNNKWSEKYYEAKFYKEGLGSRLDKLDHLSP